MGKRKIDDGEERERLATATQFMAVRRPNGTTEMIDRGAAALVIASCRDLWDRDPTPRKCIMHRLGAGEIETEESVRAGAYHIKEQTRKKKRRMVIGDEAAANYQRGGKKKKQPDDQEGGP
jgi:hypothetical protein